jgi:hypothetical protein
METGDVVAIGFMLFLFGGYTIFMHYNKCDDE